MLHKNKQQQPELLQIIPADRTRTLQDGHQQDEEQQPRQQRDKYLSDSSFGPPIS